MSKKLNRLAWGICFVLLVAYLVFYAYSEKKREEALATIQKPGSIVFYERLIAKRSGIQLDGPIANEDVEGTPYAGLSDIEIEERLDMWAGLLERHDAELKVDEEWQAVVEILKKPADALTSEEWVLITSQAKKHEGLVYAIREAAERGGPVYPLEYRLLFAIELPHLAPMREFARLLTIHARVNAEEGKYEEAAHDIVAGLNCGIALNGEDLLLNALVRVAIHRIMLDAIENSFTPESMSPRISGMLFQRLSELKSRSAIRNALIGEAVVGISTLEEYRVSATWAGPWKIEEDVLAALKESYSPIERSIVFLMALPLGKPLINLDESAYVKCMNMVIRAAALPHYRSAKELQSLENNVVEQSSIFTLFTNVLIPAIVRAPTAQARLDAAIDLTRLGIAVEDWYREHGSYPDSLQQIAYWFDGELPLDPFTGDAYRYIVGGDSFVLYSLGADAEDDGGRHDLVDGDIVWRGVEKTNWHN